MKENILVILSKPFSVDIINVCSHIDTFKNGNLLANQLLRSGTSIGANIHEGNYAQSRADFISKFQVALKECYETEYWLDIFHTAGIITEDDYNKLYNQCCKIRRTLAASLNTAKANSN